MTTHPPEVEPSEEQPGTAGGRIDAETAASVIDPSTLEAAVQKRTEDLTAVAMALMGLYLPTGPTYDGNQCDLTSDGGRTRCQNNIDAIKWEDGVLDRVCYGHATLAHERGALIIRRPRGWGKG